MSAARRALTDGAGDEDESETDSETAEEGSAAHHEASDSRQAHGSATAMGKYLQSKSKFSIMNMVKDLGVAIGLLQRHLGSGQKLPDHELSSDEKKALWKTYGHLFGSKENAQRAYDEYRAKAKSGELSVDKQQSKRRTDEEP